MLLRTGLIFATLALAACQSTVKPDSTASATFLPSISDLGKVAAVVNDAPKPVLLVLDIDDTLLSTRTLDGKRAFYGSDRWYRWQDGLSEEDPKLVPCLIAAVLTRNSEILRLEAVQPDAATVINALTVDRVIETSRGRDQRAGTERELLAAGYALRGPLPGLEGVSELPGRYTPMTYRRGILMTGGTRKGPALTDLLRNATTAYRSVVMVDDDSKNLQSVAETLAAAPSDSRLAFFGLRYAGIKDEPVPPPTAAEVKAAQESWLVWNGWMLQHEPVAAAKLEAKDCKWFEEEGRRRFEEHAVP